ncbi:MFS transporter [Rossellomorea sp. NS-SX7]|uniref:MFS transporter n=1 Tax=Rossellomorea sp. NS-SX7 TaxID=3463856 RepID=UPI0040586064
MHVSYKLISVLLVSMGIMVASNIYTFIPIYGEIAASMDIPSKSVVIAGSAFTFFYACGLLTFANIADRFGKREILILGMLASAISTALVMFSFSSLSLFITRGLQGFCLGSFAPVAFSYTYDLFEDKKRTLLLAMINSGFLFAGILGQLLSAGITLISHWTIVFLFFSIMYFILFLTGKRILPHTAVRYNGDEMRAAAVLYRLLQNKQLLLLYGIVFTLLSSFVFYYDSLTRFLHGEDELLLQSRLLGLLGVSLSLFTGTLLEKIGAYKTLFMGIAIAVSSFGLSFIYLTVSAPLLLMMSSILFVSSISLLIPTVITLIGDISNGDRSQALSLYSFILLGGTSLAPLLAMKVSYAQALLLLTGFFMVNVVIGVRLAFSGNVEMKSD